MQFSDFSSEGLARLEAKLLADVEVVRRMRVLLEEHRAVWEKAGQGVAGSPAVVPVPVIQPAVAPKKPVEELAVECLQAMPKAVFVVDELRQALRNLGSRERNMKTLMNRLMRRGIVVVEKTKTGRGGSLYRHTLPRVPAGEAEGREAAGEPGVSGTELPSPGAELPSAAGEPTSPAAELPPAGGSPPASNP